MEVNGFSLGQWTGTTRPSQSHHSQSRHSKNHFSIFEPLELWRINFSKVHPLSHSMPEYESIQLPLSCPFSATGIYDGMECPYLLEPKQMKDREWGSCHHTLKEKHRNGPENWLPKDTQAWITQRTFPSLWEECNNHPHKSFPLASCFTHSNITL